MTSTKTNSLAPLSKQDQERLESMLPIRVVLRRHADGTLEGLTEETWHLNWSATRVNVFWSGKAYSILGEQTIDGVSDAQSNCNHQVADLFTPQEMVIDPLAEDSPIRIDWARWLHASTKYDKRNAYFTGETP